MKVCKFGGTSMANSACIKRVADIVLSDKTVGYVVVSAPGKREKNDTKVTDLLYACLDKVRYGANPSDAFWPIRERFENIVRELGIDLDLTEDYEEIVSALKNGTTKDFIASRGEYFSAKILAKYIGWTFIDAKDLVRFDEKGNFLSGETNAYARGRLLNVKNIVIPGFYGSTSTGEIKTFSRGGSDITGAIVARATYSTMYENWTDVDGFMKCDPRLVENPEIMDVITYKELRELSYMGANVLHPDSIFPVRKHDIPIHIRNTFNPSAKGTLIVPTKKLFSGVYERADSVVTGIAGKRDFIAINIEKSMMNNELGFMRKVLEVIERNGLCVEHIPSGIDTLSVIIDSNDQNEERIDHIVESVREICHPDIIEIDRNLALIAVVGHGMLRKKGTATKVCSALAQANINIRMLVQGSSELNVIVGVENKDYESAIIALYKEFLD
ncbi:MAG: aspartate kinase [Clostridia bacterium]|nr:aspartate kinase [Clostridia bacterium]